jgi:hypothetical protein
MTPWTGDQFVASPLPVHKHRKTHTTQTLNIHAQSGIRTHGPGVRASEDSSYLTPLGYRDRPSGSIRGEKLAERLLALEGYVP